MPLICQHGGAPVAADGGNCAWVRPCALLSQATGMSVQASDVQCAKCPGDMTAGAYAATVAVMLLADGIRYGRITQAQAEALAVAAGIPLD